MSLFVHFERNTNNCTDCTVLSLTWMGRVCEELCRKADWWLLKRPAYFEDGWLATGNVRGVVGITLTTCRCQRKSDELPTRANYNLRGHRSHVTIVKWNEPFQKLASCDSSGTIFVWIQHEGRWAIELMNDRKTPVTDFSWSHHGQLALICYQDGFVLVGSVSGQRYWSSMLHLDSLITCGIWTPDDQQVLLGTSNGQILVIDVSGHIECEVTIKENVAITSMAWSCHKFSCEEKNDFTSSIQAEDMKSLLAVCLENGAVYLMKSYDDISPIKIKTQLNGIKMDWSHNGELLAIAGVLSEINGVFSNWVYFYTETGTVQSSIQIPYYQEPVTAITWGHLDKRIFIATGCYVNVAWISYKLASLQLLSAMAVQKCLMNEHSVELLPVVQCLQSLVSSLFGRTIKCHLPDIYHMREYVSTPPPNNNRLHCTMIHHVDDDISGSVTYTLFLENLGGLIPILKGKRVSMLRPEFVIFDPVSIDEKGKILHRRYKQFHSVSCNDQTDNHSLNSSPVFISTSSSESELDEGCVSPHVQRRRQRLKRLGREHRMLRKILTSQKYVYVDELPENEKIVSITSNIWGTKFKLLGLVPWLPSSLGTVTYRTSLLHLQPRQLKIVIKELCGPQINFSKSNNSSENRGLENCTTDFSDDEDEVGALGISPAFNEGAPVAPMTPQKQKKDLLSTYSSNAESFQNEEYPDSDYIKFLSSDEFVLVPESSFGQTPAIDKSNNNHNNMKNNFKDINSKVPKIPCTESKTEKNDNKEGTVEKDILININKEQQKQYLSCKSEKLINKDNGSFGNSIITIETCKINQKKLTNKTKLYSKDDNILDILKSKKLNNFICDKCIQHPSLITHQNDIIKHLVAMDLAVGNQNNLSKWEPNCVINHQFEENASHSVHQNMSLSQIYLNSLFWMDKTKHCGFLRKCNGDICKRCIKDCSYSNAVVKIGHKSNSISHLYTTESTNNGSSCKENKKWTHLKSKLYSKSSNLNTNQETSKTQKDESRYCEINPRKQNDQLKIEISEFNQVLNTKSKHSKIHSSLNLEKNILSLENAKFCSKKEENKYDIEETKHFKGQILNNTPKINNKESQHFQLNIENWQNKDVSKTFIQENKINNSHICEDLDDSSEPSSPRISRSIPSSPITKRKKDRSLKNLLYSPLLLRKLKWQRLVDSSDEESAFSGDEVLNKNGKNLEKSHANFKKKRKKRNLSKIVLVENEQNPPLREHILENKMPLWNETHQVYQLDFGGRVTQESAKNFQVEDHGKQVLQFGRINMNAYTLDFQQPFCALQAFAIALANITQRLK
ncbi:tubby-related protein 4-like isoform X1 [Centruroides vittatus]|uniref:tubby-related protein 4-like isoform X1 n=2 Tax=Centruroides vittatus TaxID=120091 RepID=UPI00350F11F6